VENTIPQQRLKQQQMTDNKFAGWVIDGTIGISNSNENPATVTLTGNGEIRCEFCAGLYIDRYAKYWWKYNRTCIWFN
jgi:hypothetical protein